MRAEGLKPADFKISLKIFSTKEDVWIKLTQSVRPRLIILFYLANWWQVGRARMAEDGRPIDGSHLEDGASLPSLRQRGKRGK